MFITTTKRPIDHVVSRLVWLESGWRSKSKQLTFTKRQLEWLAPELTLLEPEQQELLSLERTRKAIATYEAVRAELKAGIDEWAAVHDEVVTLLDMARALATAAEDEAAQAPDEASAELEYEPADDADQEVDEQPTRAGRKRARAK